MTREQKLIESLFEQNVLISFGAGHQHQQQQ
jgi:hypothetical protein